MPLDLILHPNRLNSRKSPHMSDDCGPENVPARDRPKFPRRAVVTAGMPYGNKDLHFGHIGGVFVHADAFARFLRQRIGDENVMFVSGTDCFGSPIVESHRLAAGRGEFDGDLQAFVAHHHERQLDVLRAYHVSLDLFAGSSIGRAGTIHREIGAQIIRTLHSNGHLSQRTTPQFYDRDRDIFLNGRQVTGRCPVQGCGSEQAYADECSLGHQFEPRELIAPVSALSGERPEMREVTNWYLNLPALRAVLEQWVESLKQGPDSRLFAVRVIEEYFQAPVIHVTKEQMEELDKVLDILPHHEQKEGRAKSLQLVFDSLSDREDACALLTSNSIRYRTGKTLVPFRLTGNLDWGLPVPDLEGLEGLTFWCWPESLWAPISFSSAYLESQGRDRHSWREWWCSDDSKVYQFIGEDNLFFYGPAEMGMFLGMQGAEPSREFGENDLRIPDLVANRHVLFLDKKASSSGKIKPPMARDLLDYYTADQLRAHFLGLALSHRSVSFQPKPLNPAAKERDGDPVLHEGNLLSNTFNRSIRSCFYTVQKFYDGIIPVSDPSPENTVVCEQAILDFERIMHGREFHQAIIVLGDFIRGINQCWSLAKPYADGCDEGLRRQTLIDCFERVRVATILMYPIAPEGAEMVREYLGFGKEFWSWDRIFDSIFTFMDDPVSHRLRTLEPRVDFFPKHPSQVPPDQK